MRTPKTRLPGDRVVHSHPDFVGLACHLKIYIYVYLHVCICIYYIFSILFRTTVLGRMNLVLHSMSSFGLSFRLCIVLTVDSMRLHHKLSCKPQKRLSGLELCFRSMPRSCAMRTMAALSITLVMTA